MSKHLDSIDNDIAEKHLLKHPFYLAWTRGELSGEALADYARQYYHHVAAFPTYLSAVHANCDDQATRKQLLDNLIDEEAGSPNHPDLWLKFAEGLGVPEADVRQTQKSPETKNLIDTFRSVCGGGSTAGAAPGNPSFTAVYVSSASVQYGTVSNSTGYELDGEHTDILPLGADEISRCKPIYETMEGWTESTVGVTQYDKLPVNARLYLQRIEQVTGVPVDIISTSPDRDHTIMMRHPYLA